MQVDVSTLATQAPETLRLELEKLPLQAGDVLIVRRSDGGPVTRAEAKRTRQAVLKAFEGLPFAPAILFMDGYELAVLERKQV